MTIWGTEMLDEAIELAISESGTIRGSLWHSLETSAVLYPFRHIAYRIGTSDPLMVEGQAVGCNDVVWLHRMSLSASHIRQMWSLSAGQAIDGYLLMRISTL